MKSKWAITPVLTVASLGLSWAVGSEPLLAVEGYVEGGQVLCQPEPDDKCQRGCLGKDPDCPQPKPPDKPSQTQTPPTTWQVTVNADGSFTPKDLTIKSGDTVEWMLSNGYKDAIIPVKTDGAANVCTAYKSYDSTDPNEFTGPMPHAASGIFSLGPNTPGFVKSTDPQCDAEQHPHPECKKAVVIKPDMTKTCLCESGVPYKTMDSTWQDPDIAGVFIRLDWKEVEPYPDEFKWDTLEREIKQAVANGKLYSLGIRAGKPGTPEWIFEPPLAVRRPEFRVEFTDNKDGNTTYGKEFMALGGPNDGWYRFHYFNLLTAVGRHLREQNAWYRALAYIKPSGMNLYTLENRLPITCECTGKDKSCKQDSTNCNLKVWADSGYTPKALTEFYQEQMGVLAREFPDKDMAYMLIQEGFPVVNNLGQYRGQPGDNLHQLDEDGHEDGDNSKPKFKDDPCKFLKKEYAKNTLPYETQQTECVLENGANGKSLDNGAPATFDKMRFVVQHDGLVPPCGDRDGKGKEGNGMEDCLPNYLVKKYEQTQVVGFQTMNPVPVNKPTDVDKSYVSSPKDLEMALQNGYCNTNAMFVEIYEERLWEIQNNVPSGLLVPDAAESCQATKWTVTSKLTTSTPSNRTLKDWAVMFHQRRMDHIKKLGLPDPRKHRHTFYADTRRTLKYVHGSKCKTAEDIASVTVEPR